MDQCQSCGQIHVMLVDGVICESCDIIHFGE
jgi:hypothetical protein